MKKLDTIDHIAIQVKDVEKSLKWYLDNFKCEIIYSDKTWAFIKFNNIKLALVVSDEHPPHFAILDKNLKIGKEVVEHRDGSFSKYLKDEDENYIELINYEK